MIFRPDFFRENFFRLMLVQMMRMASRYQSFLHKDVEMAVFLTVNHEFGHEFADLSDLTAYVNKELSAFEWLKHIPDHRLQEAGATAHQLFIGGPLDACLKMGQSSGEYHWGDATDPLIRGSDVNGQLLQRLIAGEQHAVAFFVFVMLTDKRRAAAYNSRLINEALVNPVLEYERHTAVGIINTLKGTNKFVDQMELDTARASALNFKEYTSKAQDEYVKLLNNFKRDSEIARKKISTDANFIRHRYKRRHTLLTRYVKKSIAASNAALKDAKAHLSSAKEAYSAQIDLKASVTYWSDRKDSHVKSKYVAFACVVASMALTLVCMYYYFTNFEMPALEATAKGADMKAEGLTAEDVAAILSHFLGAALLLTFLGILVKIALRQFNTHSNCALEAEERITFTKTYLALMHEGKLSSDFDRKLVLESLFRPNSFSSAQELGLSLPFEILTKALEKK